MALPTIPDYITVHLGEPDDTSARNVRVPFIDYIKNVASSEIYPTWPETSIRANIYAQISFALNRIFTEYYRSRGYDFDITSSTRFDQKFIDGRDYFDTISQIVDDVFNDYIVRQGFVEPLLAKYCDGIRVVCDGLSQWGTVELSQEGFTPYEILQYYYGDDINIVFNAPTSSVLPSYPGVALRIGSAGEDVRTIQRQLNRIGMNYPAVTPVLEPNGLFDRNTETAVENFQQIFNLTQDGIVGKATWYRIKSIYNAVKRLSELNSEGLTLDEVDRIFSTSLRLGDSGPQVRVIQYYLNVLAFFDNSIPFPSTDGVFDKQTEDSVRAFQRQAGLDPDGIVGRETWIAVVDRYDQIYNSIPEGYAEGVGTIYPGFILAEGQSGEEVRILQTLINRAAENYSYIPTVTVDGVYGPSTAQAVQAIQSNNGLTVNGITGALTWATIASLADG